MNAHLKNAVGCIPFLPWRLKVEIKRVDEIADQVLALPPFFCQTVNPISTKGGLDTKFDVLKMKAHFKNAFDCIPFLAMEAKTKENRHF